MPMIVDATRHSKKTLFDFLAYNVYADGEHAWARRPVQEFTFYGLACGREVVLRRRIAGDAESEYVDCHAWHFTPSSFELVMLELAALGEIDFSIERSQSDRRCRVLRHRCVGDGRCRRPTPR